MRCFSVSANFGTGVAESFVLADGALAPSLAARKRIKQLNFNDENQLGDRAAREIRYKDSAADDKLKRIILNKLSLVSGLFSREEEQNLKTRAESLF